ncbi:MJ0042-type zinc finger domain-containing protein [Aliamphritea spongicola]
MKQQRLITECPACKARFQVTAGQLKIAHGKVRCGTCLEVFNAELCKVPEPRQPIKAPEAVTEPTRPAAPQDKPPVRPAIPKAFIPAKSPCNRRRPSLWIWISLCRPCLRTANIQHKPLHLHQRKWQYRHGLQKLKQRKCQNSPSVCTSGRPVR